MSILKELKEMITARGGNAGSANTVAQAVDVLTDLGEGSGGSSDFNVFITTKALWSEDELPTEDASEFWKHVYYANDVYDKTPEETIAAFMSGKTVKFFNQTTWDDPRIDAACTEFFEENGYLPLVKTLPTYTHSAVNIGTYGSNEAFFVIESIAYNSRDGYFGAAYGMYQLYTDVDGSKKWRSYYSG